MKRLAIVRSLSLVLVVAAVSVVGVKLLSASHAASFSVSSYLSNFVPGLAHEAIPHGVPASYDWHSNSKLYSKTPPSADSGNLNFWGQIYVDTTDIRPANTRVAVANCRLWTLMNGAAAWTEAIDGSGAALEGGQFSEDFSHVVNSSVNFRTESDGSQSTVTVEGANAHFWPNKPLYNVGYNLRAAMVTCQTRLVLNNPSAADDRAGAHYLLGVGSDWRKSDYSCPVVGSIQVCDPVSTGKFIKVTNQWRTAVMTTMTAADLASMPLPPALAFVQPDGTYPDGTPVSSPTLTPGPTVSPAPVPTPAIVRGDLNGDGHVTSADLALLLAHWNQSTAVNTNGDLTGDGKVTAADLAVLLSNWGK